MGDDFCSLRKGLDVFNATVVRLAVLMWKPRTRQIIGLRPCWATLRINWRKVQCRWRTNLTERMGDKTITNGSALTVTTLPTRTMIIVPQITVMAQR